METAKQRAHLTPEEVQEFINLGVDFGETEMYWNISDCSEYIGVLPIDIIIGEWGRLNSSQVDISLVEGKDDSTDYCLPAPNLQEVLEVLPKRITAKSFECWLNIAYTNKNEWSVGYEHMNHQNGTLYQIMGLKHEYNSNLLDAAVALLRWVCKNHPETLKRDE